MLVPLFGPDMSTRTKGRSSKAFWGKCSDLEFALELCEAIGT
jgi:hypothetical protein